MKPVEIWASIDCSLKRIGDRYENHCEMNGHLDRLDDLKLINNLGVKKLHYPCLWELVAPKDLDQCHWKYLDERLNELKKLDLEFSVSLLHHGSGPLYTSLIDPDFPEKFSIYARLFAQRYPWIRDFTPIHDINKTALNSCLNGQWYPHLKHHIYYLKALLNQCKATVLAMREIRRTTSKARLIQTEEIGFCQSTEALKYQRDLENDRRWLSLDILHGKLTKEHPLFSYFLESGIRRDELAWFEENNAAPDVIEINHSHDSNRFLDHRVMEYPDSFLRINEHQEYADIPAVSTGQAECISPQELFKEAWHKYNKPLVITASHPSEFREAQMQWLFEMWETSSQLQSEGVDILAVNAADILKAYDWGQLRSSGPQETALTKLLKDLIQGISPEAPVLNLEGTWKTSRRIQWTAKEGDFSKLYHRSDARPVLISNSNGHLSQAFAKACGARNIYYRLMDLSDMDAIENAIDVYRPWAIIDTNLKNPSMKSLRLASESRGIRLLAFSTDMHASPSYGKDLVNECLNLLIDADQSILPLTYVGDVSWNEIVQINNHLQASIQDEVQLH